MRRLSLVLFVLALISVAAVHSRAQGPATGTPPFGSFGGGPDVINRANLNSHLTVPVLHKPGRGTNFTYDLSYDSSIWYPVGVSGSQTWQPVTNFGWRGLTEVLTGYVSNTTTHVTVCNGQGVLYTASNWVYHDTFGAPHPFSGTTQSQRGNTTCNSFDTSLTVGAQDGSGYSLYASGAFSYTATITSSLGTITNPPINSTGGAGSFTDRNGNVLSVNSSGQFFDTLSSTTPVLSVTGTGTPASPYVFTYTPPGGGTATVKMNFTQYTVNTYFHISGITDHGRTSVALVSSVVLPDNTQYAFTYEATPAGASCTPLSGTTSCVTGRIASVTVPTGGKITYSYSGGSNGILSDGSTATLQRQTPDGTWTYAQVKLTGAASQTTVAAPQLPYDSAANQTVIQFQTAEIVVG